jgi:hypothetical protein
LPWKFIFWKQSGLVYRQCLSVFNIHIYFFVQRRNAMTLAQVVYEISNNEDFAAQYRSNPESALAQKGLTLSKEEQAFLRMGLNQASGNRSKVDFGKVGMGGGWF